MTAIIVQPGAATRRTPVIMTALLIISLPVLLVATEAVSYYAENRPDGIIVSSGEQRGYLLHVPTSYDRAKPASLVISMHGAAVGPRQQMQMSGWNRLSDAEGFIVAYPAGTTNNGPRIWRVEWGGGLARDVRFISALIDTLEATYNIDPARIYANGLSNGGGMTFALSCTLRGRIAAFGMVGAAQTLPFSWCPDRGPAPVIAFNGTADPMIPYKGGVSLVSPRAFPDVVTWTRNWARRNGCSDTPVDSTVAATVARLEFVDCAGDAGVVLYTIKGGGHTWPGGEPLPEWGVGPTSTAIDATRVMWAFFQAHPLRATAATPRRDQGNVPR